MDIASAQEEESVAARLPTYPSMKSALYRARSSRLPSLPKSREEIHIEGRWQLTLSREQFLIREDGEMLIFATEENLRHLAEAETIYVDGTFEVCPRLFYQVFTINAFLHGQQFPLVYGLLPSKSRDSYNRFFMAVKEEAMNHELVIAPSAIMTDYELALVQSLALAFPGAVLRGCHFHFAQCLWRKAQKLGLAEDYKEDADIRDFIQKSAAIAFVPVNFVRIAWMAVKQQMPDDARLKEFAEYFDKTWIDGQFRLPMWNHYVNNGPRTNNHIEGWHNRLKRISRKAHPNLYEVLELFQREEAASRVTIIQLEAGGVEKAKRRKVVLREERIQKLREELDSGDRNLDS